MDLPPRRYVVPVALVIALALGGCQSGSGTGTGAVGTGGGSSTAAQTNDPCADAASAPPDCFFPGETLGSPPPAMFTGKVTWTWEGGDPKSIELEHHETIQINVSLRVQPDYAGPFEGQAFYDDAGSTWTYTSKIVSRQDPLPGGCGGETVTTSEGTGSGDFRADGLMVGILAGADPDDPGSAPSLELGVSTPSIAVTQRTESCGTSLDVTSGLSGPSLFCDEILDRFHGSWTQDAHNTVTFQCTNGHVKESGTLTGS